MSTTVEPKLVSLGHPIVDEDHRVFVTLVKALLAADDAQFPAGFAHLAEHTQAHFARENALMEEYGFPAASIHQAEHRRVLNEVAQFQEQLARGQLAMARAYVAEAVIPWFELHLTTMDSATVAFIRQVSGTLRA